MEDEKLSPGIINEKRGNRGGNIGVGCIKSAETDKHVTGRGSYDERYQGDGVKQHQFMVPFVLTGLKYKKDIEDVRRKIGKNKSDAFINPVVFQPDRF